MKKLSILRPLSDLEKQLLDAYNEYESIYKRNKVSVTDEMSAGKKLVSIGLEYKTDLKAKGETIPSDMLKICRLVNDCISIYGNDYNLSGVVDHRKSADFALKELQESAKNEKKWEKEQERLSRLAIKEQETIEKKLKTFETILIMTNAKTPENKTENKS